MMKYKYVEEFELNASPKLIYPYLHNANGLSEWFASEVKVDINKVYNFIWDNTDHYAKIVTSRINKQVKFEFLNNEKKSHVDSPFIEFKLESSELTNSTFLKVTDYSDMTEENDLDDLWEGLIHKLREIVGG